MKGRGQGSAATKKREERLRQGLEALLAKIGMEGDDDTAPTVKAEEVQQETLVDRVQAILDKAKAKKGKGLWKDLQRLVTIEPEETAQAKGRGQQGNDPAAKAENVKVEHGTDEQKPKEGNARGTWADVVRGKGTMSKGVEDPKEGKLRAQDWVKAEVCTMDYDKIIERITANEAARIVYWFHEEPQEWADLAAVLRGNKEVRLTTVQIRYEEDEQLTLTGSNGEYKDAKVPMELNGRLILRRAAVTRHREEAPNLQARTKVETTSTDPRRDRNDTVKLRCFAHHEHHARPGNQKDWHELTGNPGKHFRRWACAVATEGRRDVQDTWGFEEYDTRGAHYLKGLVRVKLGTAQKLLPSSGISREGMWFLDPCNTAHRSQESGKRGPSSSGSRKKDEGDADYVSRAYGMQTGMGIVKGYKQYGVRGQEHEGDGERRKSQRREYRVTGIPPFWDYEGVSNLLSKAGYNHPELTQRSRWRSGTAWVFTAVRDDMRDHVELEHEDQVYTVVDTRKQRKYTALEGKQLPREQVTTFGKGPPPKGAVKRVHFEEGVAQHGQASGQGQAADGTQTADKGAGEQAKKEGHRPRRPSRPDTPRA